MMITTRHQQTREVRGPQPNSVALIARPVSKHPLNKLLAERQLKEDQLVAAAGVEKYNRWMEVRNDWEESTDKRLMKNEVRRRVQGLLQQNEYAVEVRRQRLREMLQTEEEQYMRETAARVMTPIERQAKLRERAKELKAKRENERQTFVHEKLEQQFSTLVFILWHCVDAALLLHYNIAEADERHLQKALIILDAIEAYREQCEELRSTLSMQELQEVAAERQEQIKRKEELDRKKKEEEDIFARLWQADIEAKGKREEEEAKRQLGKNKETAEFLQQQMAELEAKKEQERMLVEEEAKLLKEEAELRKLEKQQELEEKRRKQEELRSVYAQSIQMKRANEARELQEQLAFDRKILEQLLEESKIEAIEEAQKKKEIREEDRRYREYLKKLKEEERLREKELERLCDAEVEKMWEKRINQWKVEKLARQKLLEEVLESRKKQLEYKLQQNLVRRERAKQEREELLQTIDNNKRIEKELREDIRRQALLHQQDLLDQMAYNSRQHRADMDEEQRMIQRQKDAELEYRMKVEDLRGRPVLAKMHPMRRNQYFATQQTIGPTTHFRNGNLN